MRQKTILFLLIVLSLGFGKLNFAQEKSFSISSYSHYVMDSLTSDVFAGRGYIDNGMNRTADFIANEFQKMGLKKVGNSYFQEFTMPINVIENAELTLNGKKLNYGIDFIVHPGSKSQTHQTKEIYTFSPTDFEVALSSETALIEFIERDMRLQNNKHLVFPPHTFEVDSLRIYYKNWPFFYRPDENENRSIFFFTEEKLTSFLSQEPKEISKFYIQSNHYNKNLNLDNYLIESTFYPNFKTKNVIAQIEGENKDSLIVLTAHFDHLGKVGTTIFYGASDNASGTAFLLELAKYYSQNTPKYTTIFIAFAAEEAGLVGSEYFAEHPLIELSRIKFLLNFDIMGAGEEGIQIVNSSIFTKEFELLKQINASKNYTPQIKKRGEACNSDHCPFYQKGVPSFFIYTLGGPGYYHDPLDDFSTLNFHGFTSLQALVIDFLEVL
ncbi:MAG: M28 family metallopeptidase [Weeksellaceae bacterium]|nr:M28 family metallopeptidase [Weeksellaceae bacterium]